MEALTVAGWVVSPLVKKLMDQSKKYVDCDPEQRPYRRRRGRRIVPSSGNQGQSQTAQSLPTVPASNPSNGETTSVVQAPTNPSPPASNHGQPIPTLASNPSTSAVQAPTNPSPSAEGSSGHVNLMSKELLEACTAGSRDRLISLVEAHGTAILLTVTPYKNSPLHLAVMLGHQPLAEELCEKAPSLMSSTNIHGETPLIAALMAQNSSIASSLIDTAVQHHRSNNSTGDLKEMLLKCDRLEENALHHALRNDFEALAVKILGIEPELSKQVNKNGESAMHMACRRGFVEVVRKLLEFDWSSYAGPYDHSALDAAIEANRKDIVKIILEKCPRQASHVNGYGNTPLCTAIELRNSEMVEYILNHDHNLAYIANETDGYTPFLVAANLGYLDIAKKITKHCPDSAYALTKVDEMNALHEAVQWEEHAFVHHILINPSLWRLISQGDKFGNLPLHYAAENCNAELLESIVDLRSTQDYTVDHTAVNVKNVNAAEVVYSKTDLFDTPKWKEAFKIVSRAIPTGCVSQLVETAAEVIVQEGEQLKSLTQMYTSNTAVVAALIAAVTFAAAFALPKGYDTDPEGQPIFAKKAVFQVFLLSDTLAMCSSLAVAFFCGLLTWKDYRSTKENKNILLNYRTWASSLMWCAYASTLIAFGTGLYTVLAPQCHWLAIIIVSFCSALPLISNLLSEGNFNILLVVSNIILKLGRLV